MLAISCSATSTAQAANVLCPGLLEQYYCDCSGDCTGHPEWCGCPEAQECCHMSSPVVVLCPDQPRANYCDCDGDCTEQPDWCACQQAEECCNNTDDVKAAGTFDDDFMSPPNNHVNTDSDNSLNPSSSLDFSTLVIAGCVGAIVSMLINFVFCCIRQRRNNKNNNDPVKSLSDTNPASDNNNNNNNDGSDEATTISDEEDDVDQP